MIASPPPRHQRPLVALWSTGYARGGGGAEQVVDSLVRHLSAADTPTLLITNGKPGRPGSDPWFAELPTNVELYVDSFPNPLLSTGAASLARNLINYFAASIRLCARFRRQVPAVVHLHFVSVDVFLLLMLRAVFGFRLVATFHGSDLAVSRISRLGRWKVRATLRFADAVTTVSDDMAAYLRQAFHSKVARCIHNGIDVAEIQRVGDDGQALGEPDHFVFVGRLHPLKRVPLMVHAFADSLAAGCGRNLYIIGDGEDRPIVEHLVAELGRRERIAVVGPVSHRTALAILAHARCLLLFSSSEGCPVAILEAMALGVPVIAADVGGVPELVIHGETGFLFPRDDYGKSVEYILRIASDSRAAGALGRNGAVVARERFDIANSLHAYRSIYDELMAPRR